mgnify:CR=1 FL=1
MKKIRDLLLDLEKKVEVNLEELKQVRQENNKLLKMNQDLFQEMKIII